MAATTRISKNFMFEDTGKTRRHRSRMNQVAGVALFVVARAQEFNKRMVSRAQEFN